MAEDPEALKEYHGNLLDAIATRLFSILKIIIFFNLLLIIFFIFINIYTPKGIAVLPFEIKNDSLNGITIADMITSELLRIQKIHNTEYNKKIQMNTETSFEAKLSADPSSGSPLALKTEVLEISMADTGMISTSYGSLDPGKIIIAFKNICPGRKPNNTIRGSLQRYGSHIILVAVLEGDNLQSWTVRESIDENNDVQFHEMIRNLTFMIAHDLPNSDVSAKSWCSLKYYTEALDAYNQYELTGSSDAIYRAGEESLKAICCERGYSKAYGLLRTVEFEYIGMGKPSKAIELCNRTIEIDPLSEYGWENRANIFGITKKINESIKDYDNATRINPRYSEAWNDKGSAYSELKRYDDAIMDFERAIVLNPDYTYAWINKGLALRAQNRYDEAINAYDKAIGIDPNLAVAWKYKGEAIKDQNQSGAREKEIKAYEKAIKINPRYAEAWNGKGLALRELGKNDEAIKAFEKAIEIDLNYAKAWYNKGLALRAIRKYNDAFIAFNEAIRIDPDYAKAWYSKGIAYEELQKYDEAIIAFNEAIQIDPNYTKAWHHKAIALNASNRTEEAIAAFSKAKELGDFSLVNPVSMLS